MTSLKSVYDNIYSGLDYGPITTARGLSYIMDVYRQISKHARILFVGAGNAYEATFLAQQGYENIQVVDYVKSNSKALKGKIKISKGTTLPFDDKSFDVVFCAECIEHIPEDEVDKFLSELLRVGDGIYFYTIADRDDPPYHSHLCIHNIVWWEEKLESLGYYIITMCSRPEYKHLIQTPHELIEAVGGYKHGMNFKCKRA